MRQTNDGFQIAEKDLQLRGPGEVLGTRQTGDVMLRIADLQRDGHMLPKIRSTAEKMLAKNPDRVDAIIRRWLGETDHFSQV